MRSDATINCLLRGLGCATQFRLPSMPNCGDLAQRLTQVDRSATLLLGVRRLSAQSVVFISALVLGGLGYIVAYLMLPRSEVNDWHLLTISGGAAAFGLSYVLRRVFWSSSQRISGRRGALVGVLAGILAHPVACTVDRCPRDHSRL